MACRGVLFALTDELAERFLCASSDEEVIELVQEAEEPWDEDYLEETDKAWDAIHRCLSDGTLDFHGGSYPLNKCILGGNQLYHGDDYIVAFVSADDVRVVSAALAGVTEPWFRERFSLLTETNFPQEYLREESFEEMFRYAWESLESIREFYERAAQAGRAVIFTVDQ